MAEASARMPELDSLRGLAALAVVIYHYTARYSQIYGQHVPDTWLFELGKYGVHLFFLISGFVILMTTERTPSVWRFAVMRFARLFPAYWVAVLLTALAIDWIGLPGRQLPWWAVGVNLTMLQAWLGVPSVDGVYWTLAIELAFYAWMALLLLFGQMAHAMRWAVLAMLAVSALNWLIVHQGLKIHWVLVPTLMLGYLHLFVAGMAFFCIRKEGHSWQKWGVLALAACIEVVTSGSNAWPVLACMAIFAAALFGHARYLHQRWLLELGAVSYGLYLVHQNIGYIVIRQLQAAGQESPFVLLLVPLLLALLIAKVIHDLVEIPAGRWIRRKLLS